MADVPVGGVRQWVVAVRGDDERAGRRTVDHLAHERDLFRRK
ncbi:hypothetical protein [Streptomyces xantholiticus]|uniref:Transposase n=1 Tax=Streptomyces xantholiticus TaxID=68285 RepID=A0ABV1UWW7_9ACTN